MALVGRRRMVTHLQEDQGNHTQLDPPSTWKEVRHPHRETAIAGEEVSVPPKTAMKPGIEPNSCRLSQTAKIFSEFISRPAVRLRLTSRRCF